MQRGTITAITFLIAATVVHGEGVPRPGSPDSPQVESPAGEEEHPALEVREFDARLIRGDGEEISGRIKVRAPESIVVRHTQAGTTYVKELQLSQVERFEIVRWKGVKQRENDDGTIYRFGVDSYRILLRDGTRLDVREPLPGFLQQILLENGNGRAYFFTFWIDLLKDDGSWFTGIEGPRDGSRVECHKEVIRTIHFLSADS